MTDRERLVELRDTMTKMCRLQACGFCKYKSFKPCCVSEAIADTMISNGVIMPPVQVGATVYCTDSYRHLIKPLEIIGFEVDYTKRICKYYCSGGDYTPAWFKPAEMGKTVFLTREEAEKALEGMK